MFNLRTAAKYTAKAAAGVALSGATGGLIPPTVGLPNAKCAELLTPVGMTKQVAKYAGKKAAQKAIRKFL